MFENPSRRIQICKIFEDSHTKAYTFVPAGEKGWQHEYPTLKQATVVEGFDNAKIDVITRDRKIAETIANNTLENGFDEYQDVMCLHITRGKIEL